jgi:hypothetical protein
MRVLTIPLLLFVAGSAKVCDSEDKANASAGAAVSASAQADTKAEAAVAARGSAAVVEPRIGGSVATAGEFSVELVVHASGLVEALVSDAHAALISEGVKLSASLRAKGGATEKVELAFSVPHARFVGHAKAGVELATGPADISLEVGGKLHGCKLEVAVALPEPSHGGQVIAAGDFSVELVAKGPEIRAFVLDAAGKAHVGGDLILKLDVGLRGGAAVDLKWDPPSLSYVGTAAADANLALQPIRLSLNAAGKAFVGAVASLDAEAKAHANANLKAKLDSDLDAKVDANAKLGAGAKAKVDAAAKADLSKAATGSVKVTPPKVDVSAGAKAGTGAKAGAGAKAGGGAKAGIKIGF